MFMVHVSRTWEMFWLLKLLSIFWERDHFSVGLSLAENRECFTFLSFRPIPFNSFLYECWFLTLFTPAYFGVSGTRGGHIVPPLSIYGFGGVRVPILFGNDLPMNDWPYSKGFRKFGCLEPSKITIHFWIFLLVARRSAQFGQKVRWSRWAPVIRQVRAVQVARWSGGQGARWSGGQMVRWSGGQVIRVVRVATLDDMLSENIGFSYPKSPNN